MQKKFDGIVKNITVAEVGSKLTKNGAKMVRITDKDGKNYSFFETVAIWDNGQKVGEKESKAHEVFKTLGDPVGKTLEIGYKEESFEFNGQPAKRNKLLFLKEVQPSGDYKMNPNGTYAPDQDIQMETPF